MAISPTLIALLITALSGWAVVRHAKKILHNGMTVSDGGGWTVILLVETMVFLAAINVATF